MPRFLDGHARANRQKPGGIAQKEVVLRVHLVPQFGTKRLNAISNEDVQRLKHRLRTKAPPTVNNVLTVLKESNRANGAPASGGRRVTTPGPAGPARDRP